MKKVLLLLVLFPLLQLACNQDKCSSSRYFNTIGVKLIPKALVTTANGITNDKTIYNDDSVLFSQFFFDGYLDAEYYSRQAEPHVSLFPTAYAKDAECANPGFDGSEEQIANVYLVALGYYNLDFQPGDTLKNAILINNKTVAQYVADNSPQIKDQYFTIKLTSRPNPKNMQAFKLIYQLTNGETYEIYTPRFKLY
jgi:hypothetical protein